MKKRIMIIEDDPAINHGIELTLGNEQYEFFNCLSLADAENQKASADLIILDLELSMRSANCKQTKEDHGSK